MGFGWNPPEVEKGVWEKIASVMFMCMCVCVMGYTCREKKVK